MLEPAGQTLQRSDNHLEHHNGIVKEAFAEIKGKRADYRISAEYRFMSEALPALAQSEQLRILLTVKRLIVINCATPRLG